jgi:NAD(P)-dependent dehydrogenase (short-subunit alcohol dehydrogenase family)
MAEHICLITGGSSGIGKALAKKFALMNFHVVLVSKTKEELLNTRDEIIFETGNKNIFIFPVDLSLMGEVKKFCTDFKEKYPYLNVLVNNAGVNLQKKKMTPEGIEYMFAVNHLAPFLLTNLLLVPMEKAENANVINIVSNTEKYAKFDLNNLQAEKSYNGSKHYCHTKLCNLMFSYELARRTEETGITSNAVHPGGVRTDIMKNYSPFSLPSLVWRILYPSLQTPDAVAEFIIRLFKSGEFDRETGKYYFKDRQSVSSPASNNTKYAKQLWEISEKITDQILSPTSCSC